MQALAHNRCLTNTGSESNYYCQCEGGVTLTQFLLTFPICHKRAHRAHSSLERQLGLERGRLTKVLPIIPEILQVVMYQVQNFV